MKDILVEQGRGVREELIEQFGGIDGYMEHCIQQEKPRVQRTKLKPRQRKAPGRKPVAKSS